MAVSPVSEEHYILCTIAAISFPTLCMENNFPSQLCFEHVLRKKTHLFRRCHLITSHSKLTFQSSIPAEKQLLYQNSSYLLLGRLLQQVQLVPLLPKRNQGFNDLDDKSSFKKESLQITVCIYYIILSFMCICLSPNLIETPGNRPLCHCQLSLTQYLAQKPIIQLLRSLEIYLQNHQLNYF